MHFERYSRWIWPQKSMKFISIDENLWHKPKAFDFRSCLCLCFRLWIYSYSTICVFRFVCAAQFICLTIPSPEVGQCQRKFFFLSLCINIWLLIWTPLPVVIKTHSDFQTFQWWGEGMCGCGLYTVCLRDKQKQTHNINWSERKDNEVV